jgi:hypothetical protein
VPKTRKKFAMSLRISWKAGKETSIELSIKLTRRKINKKLTWQRY